jgi:para-aminobenzoate synthetase/4-amino-4-deoxychorismate lyase
MSPEPLVARADWLAAVSEAQTLIASGDIYQANLSFPCRLPLAGHPLALFARLFDPRSAPEGGLVHDGAGRWWLSFSPELLFAVGDGRIEARPMKGTAARGPSLAADRDAAAALAADPKNRAENLMITDLVRHDLARVAVPGSVRVPALLAVETYPTVHQMTSTVTARLAPGRDALDVLRALFPAGSITGAPKIRAAEVIAALEPLSRDIYCGSIGWVAPGAAAARFNVAIRTIAIEGGAARLGLGAGIVADSDPQAEWAECLVKARFLERSGPAALLETMRREADGTIPRLARHLDRLQASAARFGFRFDRAAIDAGIAGLPRRAGRLRLLIAPSGAVALQLGPLPDLPAAPASLALAPLPLAPDDWRLVHKTTDRGFYARARAAAGTFEVAFHMPDGRVTEGSFTSLFVERDGRLATPPATLPLLPGVLRDELLAGGAAVEAELGMADLAEASAAGRLFLGNSLRGLFPARLVTP